MLNDELDDEQKLELIQKIMTENQVVLIALAFAEDAQTGMSLRFSFEDWDLVQKLQKSGDNDKLAELCFKLAKDQIQHELTNKINRY